MTYIFIVNEQTTIKKSTKGCILLFLCKGDLGRITYCYSYYNALLLNRIWPEIEKIILEEIDLQHNTVWFSVESSTVYAQKIFRQH